MHPTCWNYTFLLASPHEALAYMFFARTYRAQYIALMSHDVKATWRAADSCRVCVPDDNIRVTSSVQSMNYDFSRLDTKVHVAHNTNDESMTNGRNWFLFGNLQALAIARNRKSSRQYSISVKLNVLFPVNRCRLLLDFVVRSFAEGEVNALSDERQKGRWISKSQHQRNDASQFIQADALIETLNRKESSKQSKLSDRRLTL